jgi:hypothetical protein
MKWRENFTFYFFFPVMGNETHFLAILPHTFILYDYVISALYFLCLLLIMLFIIY